MAAIGWSCRLVALLPLLAGGCMVGGLRYEKPSESPLPPLIGNCQALRFGEASSLDRAMMAVRTAGDALTVSYVFSRFSSAVGQSGLRRDLDEAPEVTVLVPDGGGSIDNADVDEMTRAVRRHVIPRRLSPQDLPGRHEAWDGTTVSVEMKDGVLRVNGLATVVCGNLVTANGVVYVLDGRLD